MVPKTATKPKVSAIIGHGVHEHYALYNVRYENGAEDVKLELDIPESQNLLDDYKQSVDPQNLSDNGVYIVEKILNHRKVSGKMMFLVQWAGFENPVWNTELTRAGLKNSKGVVEKYLKSLEKPKKTTRVKTGRGNRKTRGAKADAESESDSDSDGSSTDSDSERTSSDSDAKPSTSKRVRHSSSGSSSGSKFISKRPSGKGQLMVVEEEEDSGEEGEKDDDKEVPNSGEESDESEEDEDVDDEEVEEENRDDDNGMEMMLEPDDGDDEEADGPIVEHPDDNEDGEGEGEVREEAAHDGGAEQRRQVRLWNHRWHQYHVLQFEMEYSNRFFITYGFPPLYIPQYDPNGPADLVPPEHEPYAEEPEEDEQ